MHIKYLLFLLKKMGWGGGLKQLHVLLKGRVGSASSNGADFYLYFERINIEVGYCCQQIGKVLVFKPQVGNM